MSKNLRKALISELFKYKKNLSLEQDDIEKTVTIHLEALSQDENPQIAIVESFKRCMNKYTYDKDVVSLLETVGGIADENELYFDLEKLYKDIDRIDNANLYLHAKEVIRDIMNINDDDEKRVEIFTNLSNYDYIPQVRYFILRYTQDPVEKANYSSKGGRVSPVYTVVEKVDGGFLAFIGDCWFMIKDDVIEKAVPSDVIKDKESLYRINLLQYALLNAEVESDVITFNVDGDTLIGLGLEDGQVYLNGEKADKETTVDTLFDSSLVSFMNRDLFPVLKEVIASLDKFVELDLVKKVTNAIKPNLEVYCMNYNEKIYCYTIDTKGANSFFEYDSATVVVNDMMDKFGIDLTEFYKDKFKGEAAVKAELKDKEKSVASTLEEITENIDKIAESGMLETSDELKEAYDMLNTEKEKYEAKLREIKSKLANNNFDS